MLRARAATVADKDFIYTLTKENMHALLRSHGGWDDEQFWQGYDRTKRILVEDDGQPVAAYTYEILNDVFFIANLQVTAPQQNKGVGTWMLSHAQALAKRKNKRALELEVFPDNPALRLYERFGFQKVELTPAGRIWMRKTLPAR